MVVYADTSFLFSLYTQDGNTTHAAQLAAEIKTALVFTSLQRHELRNAFRLALFRRDITPEQCEVLLKTIELDIQTGVLSEAPVAWAEVYSEAEALSAAHTGKIGTRATDNLHVAAASALGIRNFYTFDIRQKALAVKAGMRVKP